MNNHFNKENFLAVLYTTTLSALSSLMLVGSAQAQSTPENANATANKKSENVKISLLAIGDLPPILYKDTAKGPVFIDPPKKDTPPPLLFVKSKDSKDGFAQLGLGLNTPMPPIVQKSRDSLTIFEDKASAQGDEDSAKTPYLNINLPDEGDHFTVILARNPQTKNWRTKPRNFVLKNDPLTFPPNSVRLINLSRYPIKGQLAGASSFSLLPAGDHLSGKIVPVKSNQQVLTYKFAGNIKKNVVILADTATSFYPGTRLNIVFYDGDGEGSQDKLRFCLFSESPVTPSNP